MNAGEVLAAARGASLVVHAVNPPGFPFPTSLKPWLNLRTANQHRARSTDFTLQVIGTQTAITDAIRGAAGRSNIPVRSFPWPLVTRLSPFKTLFREMAEMRYLWQEPLQLNNAKLLDVLKSEPRTPLGQAVRTTLAGLKCTS